MFKEVDWDLIRNNRAMAFWVLYIPAQLITPVLFGILFFFIPSTTLCDTSNPLVSFFLNVTCGAEEWQLALLGSLVVSNLAGLLAILFPNRVAEFFRRTKMDNS